MALNPIQALCVVRFHATRGQDLVSIFPQDHGLSEQQLLDIKMLCMQERIESSPNQQARFMFKVRNKKQKTYKSSNHSNNNNSNSNNDDLYGYTLFQRSKDVGGSTRGYFHQSVVLITNIHQTISIGSTIGCNYRKLFYEVLHRLSIVLSDLPALESAAGVYSELTLSSYPISPTSHTLEGLHHTIEAAYTHFLQWNSLGWGLPSSSSSSSTRDVVPPTPPSSVVIGFDLDMTLVDSSTGITHCMTYILNKHGIHHITTEEMRNTIGVPLRDAFLTWIPNEEKCDEIVAEYRAIFDEIALPKITLLPGALESLIEVKRNNATILIVSSRMEQSIHSILNYTGINNLCDVVKGSLFGEKKGIFLKERNACIYVGDHTGDVIGAKAAGNCYSVAVCTGPISKEDLQKEGADIIFDDLVSFPQWLSKYLADKAHVCVHEDKNKNKKHTELKDGIESSSDEEFLSLPFLGEVLNFPHPKTISLLHAPSVDGLPIEALALARVGLLPHIWTLWEMLIRGRDILVFSPSAAVTSSVITAMLALLTPDSTHCSGYDVRPYIATYDSDVHSILTEKNNPCVHVHDENINDNNKCFGLSRGCKLSKKSRLVGISNPYLLRSFENFHCAIFLPNPDLGHDVSPLFSSVNRVRVMKSHSKVDGNTAAIDSNNNSNNDSSSSSSSSISSVSNGNSPPKSGSFHWTSPLSTAASGITNMFSSSSSNIATPEFPYDPNATISFTPLGVGYISSNILRNHFIENPHLCYDYDETGGSNSTGKKVYRPILVPIEPHGTPYIQNGAFPTVLRYIENNKNKNEGDNSKSNGSGPSSSFEKVHDEWVSKKGNRMDVSTSYEVRGTEQLSLKDVPNHSRHAIVNTSSSNISKGVNSKSFGLILVRTGTGKSKSSSSFSSSSSSSSSSSAADAEASSTFSFSVNPDKELQSQLDTIMCQESISGRSKSSSGSGSGGNSNGGSCVAIADILIREHMHHLNTAVLEPFRMLSNITDLTNADKACSAHKDLIDFYSLTSSENENGNSKDADNNNSSSINSINDEMKNSSQSQSLSDTDSDTDPQIDHAHIEEELELLEGAIAAFQRSSIPSGRASPVVGVSSCGDDNDVVHVPLGIRKVFFDHSNSISNSNSSSSGRGIGSKNGGVCSPFMLDVAKSRFVQEFMREIKK